MFFGYIQLSSIFRMSFFSHFTSIVIHSFLSFFLLSDPFYVKNGFWSITNLLFYLVFHYLLLHFWLSFYMTSTNVFIFKIMGGFWLGVLLSQVFRKKLIILILRYKLASLEKQKLKHRSHKIKLDPAEFAG